jgi:homospermidine synthase
MITFERKVLFLGYGSVAQCALPLVFKHLNVKPSQITVLDFEDRRATLKEWTDQGVSFVQDKVTEENMGALLGKYVAEGDVLIDLAWNIDCGEILQWCHDRGVLYLNTSVEVWDPYKGMETSHPTERTLYHRHMKLRAMKSRWSEPGVTAVLEHGANPGLVSHWTKFGLLAIADRALAENKFEGRQKEAVVAAAKEKKFNLLAEALGVKAIHCSERDTQISNLPKEVGEFVNTWSVEGFREEGIATAEMGWGTHEKQLPALAFEHSEGPKNQICLAKMGMNTWVRSWVPGYEIHGMVVRHGEAFSISDSLTVWDRGDAVYRPTVHYAYCPTDVAIASLNELRGNNYDLQTRSRIMGDEIVSGADTLGALIMGHPYKSWWVGSRLSIEASRKLVPGQNATTLQVAISVVAAMLWMIENPKEGICLPDNLPHETILEVANPYLGDFLSLSVDWTPLSRLKNIFEGFHKPDLDLADPWQFKNFLVQE